jgi:hypothetical protein
VRSAVTHAVGGALSYERSVVLFWPLMLNTEKSLRAAPDRVTCREDARPFRAVAVSSNR